VRTGAGTTWKARRLKKLCPANAQREGEQSEIAMPSFKMRMTGNSPIIFLFTPSD
jgi:hypothetical protein